MNTPTTPARSSVDVSPSKRTTSSTIPRIPRPPNAFMLYRSAMCRELRQTHQADVSVVTSDTWGKMSVEEKKPWYNLAAERQRQHKIKYPDYQFRPQAHRSKAPKIPRDSVRRTAKCQALRGDIASAVITGRDTSAAEKALKKAQIAERTKRRKRKDRKLESTSRSSPSPTPSSGALSSPSLSHPGWEPAIHEETILPPPSAICMHSKFGPFKDSAFQRPSAGFTPAYSYCLPPTPDLHYQPSDFWNDDYQSSPTSSSTASSSRMTTCLLPAIVEKSTTDSGVLEQAAVWSNSVLFAQDGTASTLQMIDDICSELNLVFAQPPPCADEYETTPWAYGADSAW